MPLPKLMVRAVLVPTRYTGRFTSPCRKGPAMPFFVLAIAVQVALVIHVIKTGRDRLWIWVLLMAPLIGGLAYLLLELMPEWRRSAQAQTLRKKMVDITDPHRNLKQAQGQLRRNETTKNLITMAEECMNKGLFEEAIGFYTRALKGQYASDPLLLEGLARAQFGGQDYPACRQTLEDLIAANPDYQSKIGHVLYARSLFELGEREAALKEFTALSDYHATALVKYHLGELLSQSNRPTDALNQWRSVLEQENAWDPTGDSDQPWLDKAAARIKACQTH